MTGGSLLFFNALHGWLSRHIFQFVLLSLISGYFFPLQPTPSLKLLVMLLFSYMTFTTGLATSFRDFVRIAKTPGIPLYTLGVIHIATPIVAWVAGHLFFPGQHLIQLGYLISATIPVGVTSVIWTSIVRGNVALALVTVTMDTLIAPVLLPLFILLAAGISIQIDYPRMIFDLLIMITGPSIAGMLLHDATNGRIKAFASGFGGVLSRLSFFGVIFLNSTFVTPSIQWNSQILKILGVTSLVVAVGYILGYVAGRFIHAAPDIVLCIIYTTGMRNIATGLVIAMNYFTPETALPIALAMLFQQPFAALTAKIYHWRYPKEESATEGMK